MFVRVIEMGEERTFGLFQDPSCFHWVIVVNGEMVKRTVSSELVRPLTQI
jgi:hypothetical protein